MKWGKGGGRYGMVKGCLYSGIVATSFIGTFAVVFATDVKWRRFRDDMQFGTSINIYDCESTSILALI